jgi:hypothetical protein
MEILDLFKKNLKSRSVYNMKKLTLSNNKNNTLKKKHIFNLQEYESIKEYISF